MPPPKLGNGAIYSPVFDADNTDRVRPGERQRSALRRSRTLTDGYEKPARPRLRLWPRAAQSLCPEIGGVVSQGGARQCQPSRQGDARGYWRRYGHTRHHDDRIVRWQTRGRAFRDELDPPSGTWPLCSHPACPGPMRRSRPVKESEAGTALMITTCAVDSRNHVGGEARSDDVTKRAISPCKPVERGAVTSRSGPGMLPSGGVTFAYSRILGGRRAAAMALKQPDRLKL